MGRYVTRRALWALFVVAVAVTLVFTLMFGVGSPCAGKLGAQARDDAIRTCEAHYGFDRPLLEQYASYMGVVPCVRRRPNGEAIDGRCGLLQGQLGESIIHGDSVTQVVLTRLPRTMLLGGMAMLFQVLFGVLLGVIAAVRRHTWFDTGFMATAFLGISAPTFLTGLLFLYFFAFRLGWFPVGGYGVTAWEHVTHAALPAITLAIMGAATYARIMRSEMAEVLSSDFVRTARAKGLSPMAVTVKHGVRNALLPIVTLMGLNLALLVSGAIITEEIFAWPGVGRLALEAILNEDAFMVVGIVVVVSVTVQFGNLLADLAVAALDPRIGDQAP